MWKKILGGVVVLAVLAAIFGDGEGSSVNLAEATPDFEVSCSSLIREVSANEARASAKYEGKVIKISGRVDNINDTFGGTQVNLTDGQEYSFTNCSLYDLDETVAINLNKGQSVSFTCNSFQEIGGGVNLRNCS